jgi:hypothetical protein
MLAIEVVDVDPLWYITEEEPEMFIPVLAVLSKRPWPGITPSRVPSVLCRTSSVSRGLDPDPVTVVVVVVDLPPLVVVVLVVVVLDDEPSTRVSLLE